MERRIGTATQSPAYLICGGSHHFANNLPNGWRVVRIEVAAGNIWRIHKYRHNERQPDTFRDTLVPAEIMSMAQSNSERDFVE